MRSLLVLALGLLAACPNPTRFEGDAFVPGGPAACAARCASEPGLEMASFIYAGEFSTACVCRVRPAPAQSLPAPATSSLTQDSDASAAVGVETTFAPAAKRSTTTSCTT